MPLFQNATFFISAHHLRDLPPASGIEVAFAGRSNAGKSSALNTLANHNRLAFVSKQPGRTQLINFFTLGNDRHLVDLPGYGYAKVPEAMRAHWQNVLARYLSERSSLGGLVLVMDSRHPLTPLDRQMLDWFCPSGKPVHVLLTKSDKLSRGEASLTLNKVRKELVETWGNACSIQLFSSLKKLGVEEAEKVIGKWLFDEDSNSGEDHIPNTVP
ncbi:MAG: ribosome biogenesis GTP-binding protein YihA/YsxC [Methylotenera sp.]|jgi:GTP-binding protein|nr:ribosome biogenesis GTP-binding protein YihA/YsxC [Methylotenera sp.]HOY87759.1 ribosome biogenesis GTP-binding protein YihA/YsxC [Methylotenera sp.]HPH09151.1 ribosome biogenesis GTP-binding protein YihA/YsxC [Methylotenera sp.]HPM49715.1 ribosome biogenesis GTP-binding protein YihA/YsxC [Methylotenera sp.]HPV32912.1 ribosome biogenesis GTP-binding protein YihA/YsxC [Methylotenera sp.]